MSNGNGKDSSRKLFVSDIHIGTRVQKNPDNKHDYRWLSDKDTAAFANFLLHLGKIGNIDEVILLGDIMDTWVYPIDEVPPAYGDIINDKRNIPIITNLNALAEKVNVIYMPGNHDMTITEAEVKKFFPKVIWGGNSDNGSDFRDSRLLAEHGHAHAMFNAPDFKNDPKDGLPIGYFISRIAATKVARSGEGNTHYSVYVRRFFDLLGGHETLPQEVLDAVVEDAELKDNDVIAMRNGKNTTIGEVREKYLNLYKDWVTKTSPGTAIKAVLAETPLLGGLGNFADDLTKKGGTKIVIFGHTHDALIKQGLTFSSEAIYANCGTWCKIFANDNNSPYSFAIAETLPVKTNISLCHWDPTRKDPMFFETVKSYPIASSSDFMPKKGSD